MSGGVIDFAEIEEVKENVQPLRAGRNPKDLAKQVKGLKAQPLSNTVSVFEEASREWEDKLAAYAGDDPLEVWDEYIKWAQQNATSDKLAEQLVGLLQRCTRKFQAVEQYKDDPRYLRIWIKYIDTVTDPADIFEFLEANRIGTGLALFYTSWALVLELKKSMYAEAYQKLDQGIQRKAHPVEKVKTALKDFQHRMNQRTIETMKNAALESKPAGEPKRGREFGDQLTKKREVARAAPAVSSASSVAGTTARRGPGGAGPAPRSVPVQGAGNKAGFSIFCDDGADTGAAAPGGFAHLPGEKERSKENSRAATKWTRDEAGTIPQKRTARPTAAASQPAAAKAGVDFELFVDEQLQAQESSSPQPKQPVRLQLEGRAGKQRDQEAIDRQERPLAFLAKEDAPAAADSELAPKAEQDFRMPPSKMTAPVEGGALKGARAGASTADGGDRVATKRPRVDPKNRNRSADGTGVAAYDRSLLQLPDGEELCPEEARVLARFGMAALQGTLSFGAPAPSRGGAIAQEEELEFKHPAAGADVEMSTVGPAGEDKEHGEQLQTQVDIPNETQPSPTFSSFAPKHVRKTPGFGAVQFSVQTPLLHEHILEDEALDRSSNTVSPLPGVAKHSATAVDPKHAAATPHHPRERTESLDHVPPTLTKFGGDLSFISKAANSTFFANSSQTILCPAADANFSLHETDKINDENCAPAHLSFTNNGASDGAASENRPCGEQSPVMGADFFSAAHADASPTIVTKKAHNSALDLMPSPTQTVPVPSLKSSLRRSVGTASKNVQHQGPKGANQEAPDAQQASEGDKMQFCANAPQEQSFSSPVALAGGGGGGGAGERGGAKGTASPTLMTKNAAEQAFDLMPSPTQTCMPPPRPPQPTQAQVADENGCVQATGGAAKKPRGLRAQPAPLEAAASTPPASFASASAAAEEAPGQVPEFFAKASAAVSPTIITKQAHLLAFDLMPSPTATQLPSLATQGAGKETYKAASEFRPDVAPSPTINTKKAERDVFDLMPSPTATHVVTGARLEFCAEKGGSDAPAAGGGGFMIREDTSLKGFIAGDDEPVEHRAGGAAGGGGGGGFFIREDTNLKGLDMGSSDGNKSQGVSSGGGGGGGFVIREDTNLKGLDVVAAVGAGSGGFMIREDTNLKGIAGAEMLEGGEGGSNGGFQIREDTNVKGFKALEEVDMFQSAGTSLLPSNRIEPSGENAPGHSKRRGLCVLQDASAHSSGAGASSEPEPAQLTMTSGAECGAPAVVPYNDENAAPMPTQSAGTPEADDVEMPPCAQQAADENRQGVLPAEETSSSRDESAGLQEIGTLYCDLNTIAEGSSHEDKSTSSSVALSLNQSRGVRAAEAEEAAAIESASPAFKVLEDDPSALVEGMAADKHEESLDLMPSPTQTVRVTAPAAPEERGDGAAVQTANGEAPQQVQTARKLSPLSQAVRDKVRKSVEESLNKSSASDLEAVPENEAATDDEDGAVGFEHVQAAAEEADLVAAVADMVATGASEEGKVEALFWKAQSAAGSRGSSSGAAASSGDGIESALDTNGSLNSSSSSGRSRRARSSVCYKELPINTKCRQGANPWGEGRTSVSSSSSSSSHGRKSKSPNSSLLHEATEEAEQGADEEELTVTVTQPGLLAVEGGIAQGFTREEESRRVRKVKASVRTGSGYVSRVREAAPAVRISSTLQLQRANADGAKWRCEALLGKGNWASVYLVRRVQTGADLLAGLGEEDTGATPARQVLKVLGEANVWEMHVSSLLYRTVAEEAKSSLTRFESVIAFKDATWLISEYRAQPSLQQVINAYRKGNKKMDEPLVMFYAIELLRAVEAMHAAGVLHCDIKPDNILLRDNDVSDSSWLYQPTQGFGAKGVELIDYGCAIDRNMYPADTVFHGRSNTEAFECTEMLQDKTWTTQADWFAVASTIHCLLHNEYMAVELSSNTAGVTSAAPKLPLKRYWKVELWKDFFDTLMNSHGPERGAADVAAVRGKFEQFFAHNESKCAAVRVCLMKQDLLLDQFLDAA